MPLKVAIPPKRISAPLVSSHYASLWSIARFALRREREARTLPRSFRELLALHMEQRSFYSFESVYKHKYTDRGVRKMLARYAAQAGITRSMSAHKWRHFLFTWLKKEGIDDALIQPYTEHTTLNRCVCMARRKACAAWH